MSATIAVLRAILAAARHRSHGTPPRAANDATMRDRRTLATFGADRTPFQTAAQLREHVTLWRGISCGGR